MVQNKESDSLLIPLDDYVPPQSVQENARQGLLLREKWKRGGTHIGVARALELSSGSPIEPQMIFRMVSYFARHEVDKRSQNFGNLSCPSAGYIAWLLWGGDEGRIWAIDLKNRINVLLPSHKKNSKSTPSTKAGKPSEMDRWINQFYS